MTLDDLNAFLAIAETQNLTTAAQQLFVSQPALSKRLSRCETEIGAVLFERGQGTRKLTLTPAGIALLPFARKWNSLQHEFSMMHDINSYVHFFVEATNSIGAYILPAALRAFHIEAPETELVVRHNESRDCYANVHDKLADLAFVTREYFYQNIITTPLLQEEMLLLSAKDEGDALVDTDELVWEKEVNIPWNSLYMHWRQEKLAFSRHPAVSVSNVQQAAPFLLEDGCWVIVPATTAYAAMRYYPQLHAFSLTNPPPARTIYYIEDAGRRHPATEQLLKLLHRQIKGMRGVTWLLK